MQHNYNSNFDQRTNAGYTAAPTLLNNLPLPQQNHLGLHLKHPLVLEKSCSGAQCVKHKSFDFF